MLQFTRLQLATAAHKLQSKRLEAMLQLTQDGNSHFRDCQQRKRKRQQQSQSLFFTVPSVGLNGKQQSQQWQTGSRQ